MKVKENAESPMQIRMYHNHTHMRERVKKLVVDGRLILPRTDAGTSVQT